MQPERPAGRHADGKHAAVHPPLDMAARQVGPKARAGALYGDARLLEIIQQQQG